MPKRQRAFVDYFKNPYLVIPMTTPVLFEEIPTADGYVIARATLNAAKSINSLTLEIIRQLDAQLRAWADHPQVVCVFLDGAGEKGFCAGGDVRKLYDSARECGASKRNEYAETFFGEEYVLDHRIHTYPKPLIAWGNGVVMGGGVGLLAGASHRVVTETTRFAMPEITIGLFPDVGGSYFLNRMPGRSGLFLGLTGAHCNASDAFAKISGRNMIWIVAIGNNRLIRLTLRREVMIHTDQNGLFNAHVKRKLKCDIRDRCPFPNTSAHIMGKTRAGIGGKKKSWNIGKFQRSGKITM